MNSEKVKLIIAFVIATIAAAGGIVFLGVILAYAWKEILFCVAFFTLVLGVPWSVLWSFEKIDNYFRFKDNR